MLIIPPKKDFPSKPDRHEAELLARLASRELAGAICGCGHPKIKLLAGEIDYQYDMAFSRDEARSSLRRAAKVGDAMLGHGALHQRWNIRQCNPRREGHWGHAVSSCSR